MRERIEPTKRCGAVSPHGTKCSLLLHLGVHFDETTSCVWMDSHHLHDNNCAGAVEACAYIYASGWRCHQAATDEEWCRAHIPEPDEVEDYHGRATGGVA